MASVIGGARQDPADQTANYNTPLSPGDEAAFQAWLKKTGKAGDLYDYDMRGFWKAGAKFDKGHGADTWKKPNHPTFSDGSIYSGPDTPGGQWAPMDPPSEQYPRGTWAFAATPQNMKYQDPGDLQAYFQRAEPGSIAIPPADLSGLVGVPMLPRPIPMKPRK